MIIKVYDYNNDIHKYSIPDDTAELHVTVLSGDEVVELYGTNGELFGCLDPLYDQRNHELEYFDGEYRVKNVDFERWMQRTGSYDENWISWNDQVVNFLKTWMIEL